MFAIKTFQAIGDVLRMELGYTPAMSPGISSHQVSLAETKFIGGVCERTCQEILVYLPNSNSWFKFCKVFTGYCLR
jgi:hypothetical protein